MSIEVQPLLLEVVVRNMFHLPEVRTEASRQSLKCRGNLVNHLLESKRLPRNYKSICENEGKVLCL